jgi:membrane glycosyltransferase
VPGAAQLRGAVQQRDLVEAVPAQLDRGGYATEPRSDDHHAHSGFPPTLLDYRPVV